MDPDFLTSDNLKCVFGSGPQDVATKRKHTDLLDNYINGHLVKQDLRATTRTTRAAAIIAFYKRNDAPLVERRLNSIGCGLDFLTFSFPKSRPFQPADQLLKKTP
jgi:hypothetical protein